MSLKEALQLSYAAELRVIREANPRVSQPSSATVRCPLHGKHQVARFVAGGGVPSQYVCGLCWNSIGTTEEAEK